MKYRKQISCTSGSMYNQPGSMKRSLILMVLCAGILIPAPMQAQERQYAGNRQVLNPWANSPSVFNQSDMALDLAEALTFTRYPTYPHYVEMMQHFASSYPEICRLDTLGTSAQGRLLLALKVSDQAAENDPEAAFFYSSSMHGDELVGYSLMLRLIDTLLTGYGTDVEINRLVDNLEIWINPLANPDGSYGNGGDTTLQYAIREIPGGIDLNRDFPDIRAGDADDTTGRARETRLMMEFLRHRRFTLSANIHSGEEVVNYPWDYSYDLHADDQWYRFISREYADEARAVDPGYMPNFLDGITHGASWYPVYGGRQDYVNHYLEGREVTLELYLGYLLESQYLEEYWQKNYRSLINYMSQCLYGIRGTVTDSVTGAPLAAQIMIPGHDSSYSVVHSADDHGDFYRLIKEGVYDLVVSAEGYLPDTIPGVVVTDYEATMLDVRLVSSSLGADPGSDVLHVLLWPNPAHNVLFINFGPGFANGGTYIPHTCQLSVIAMDGRCLLKTERSFTGLPVGIPVQSLHRGIYVLKINLGDQIFSRRFVKE